MGQVSREQAILNVLTCYYAAEPCHREAGARWYRVEGERCAAFGEKRGLSRRAIAGAAAAISPGLRWDTVFAHLDGLIRKGARYRVPTYCKEFVNRAYRCLNDESPLEVLSGDKTRAFYRLLSWDWWGECLQPDGLAPVVIDGHAWNIARGEFTVFRTRPGYSPPQKARIWPARYRFAAEVYRAAAEIAEVPAHVMQASTWLFWRDVHSRGNA